MHISFERRGGFTGIPITLTIDTESLPPETATHLHHRVETADFFHLPAMLPAPAQPDRFQYTVTIRAGDRSHSITVGETAIPESLKPLLDSLLEIARQR